MLYNLSPYNHNSGREADVPTVRSPTLSILPEVPLDFFRKEQEKENRLMSKSAFTWMLFLSALLPLGAVFELKQFKLLSVGRWPVRA